MQYSVVNYSTIDKRMFRLEAEFHTANVFTSNKYFTGEEILELGQYNSIYGINDKKDGYPVLRMNEFNNLFTGKPKLHSNKFSLNDFNIHSLKVGDILICRTNGNPKLVGKSALVAKDYPYVYESHLFKVRPIEKYIKSSTLAVFLNTKYGKMEIEKFAMQGNQANFSLAKFKELRIPEFIEEFNISINEIVFESFKLLENSQEKQTHAQNLLLSELGLTDWKLQHRLNFVKNYSETEQAGRIDAEYFQPKYAEIIEVIKNYSGGWETLGNLVSVKKCVEVGSREYLNEGIPFIRVSNLSPFEITEEKYISTDIYDELTPDEDEGIAFEESQNHQPKQGEMLFSKDATPGIAYLLNEKPRKMIPSGGILRLKSKTKKVNNEYLTLVLNSILTKEQINRDVGGSVILHWRPEQVKETVIPILPEETQTQIQRKVTESFKLRKQSKYLLESAKRAVEMAIEKNEQTAMKWLKKEVENG